MGITLTNRNHSIDLGYAGFNKLRNTIASCLDSEFAELYKELDKSHHYKEKGFSSEEEFFADHDRKVLNLCKKKQLDAEVVNFLYRSDADDTSVSAKTCRHIWKYIKDYDDNIIYGYAARIDRAMFKDFKKIVEECTKKRWVMRVL